MKPSLTGQKFCYFHLTTAFLFFIIVSFFRCAHCRSMSDDWDKLADDYAGHPVALIGQIDCTSDEGQPICEDFDVTVRFSLVIHLPNLNERELWSWILQNSSYVLPCSSFNFRFHPFLPTVGFSHIGIWRCHERGNLRWRS
jgi:hypothetical protein